MAERDAANASRSEGAAPDAGPLSLFSSLIVLQPTTLCNLDCKYCYLPERRRVAYMAPETTEALSESLKALQGPMRLVWHGGEPLATGTRRFRELLRPLRDHPSVVEQSLQTNATLINDEWCQLFREYGLRVGISLDGPRPHNSSRVDWQGIETYNRVVAGLELLRRHAIPFSVIAVVTTESVTEGRSLIQFFRSLGCTSLGINIEENEGIAKRRMCGEVDVEQFWSEALREWLVDPSIHVREFHQVLGRLRYLARGGTVPSNIDLIPTIDVDGNVVLLSPEFVGTKDAKHNDFVVGNIRDRPLGELLARAGRVSYVSEFLAGVGRCKASCAYFDVCGGGQAANKYFELGSLDATETRFCRGTVKALVNAIRPLVEERGAE